MSNHIEDKFIIVIRSAGERTTNACKNIVLNELPNIDVKLIELTPFEEALRETFRIGMNSSKEWMICIDADLLPRKGFVKDIFNYTKSVSPRLFTFKTMIYDKLLLTHRMAGFRVYRNELLSEAFEHIPLDGKKLRPESYAVRQMTDKGYQAKVFEYVVGLHDFEQSYRDIYRKSYVHATKHAKQIGDLIPLWKEKSKNDNDFSIALKGALDGLLSRKKPKADLSFFKKLSENAQNDIGWIEKKPLTTEQAILVIEEHQKFLQTFAKEYTWKGIKKNIRQKGLLEGLLYTTGHILESAGKKLKDRTERESIL